MNRFFLILYALFAVLQAKAYEPRELLQKKASLQQVKASLVPRDQWIKYPAYQNREGWDAFTGSLKAELIADGEKYLHYEWKVIKATDYLAYERSGSRVVMENPFNANNSACVPFSMTSPLSKTTI